jgi:hypothetical protein
MPQVYDPSNSDQKLVALDGTGARDNIATIKNDGDAPVRLWDCLDQSWSGAVPRAMAYEKNMAKIVGKCSACMFTTAAEQQPLTQVNLVRTHAQQVYRVAEEHKGAAMSFLMDGTGQQCTGCGFIFALGKNRAQRHLTNILEAAVTHTEVDALLVRRYALEPSEPIVYRREHVYSHEGLVGPVVTQVEWKRRKRHRSRRGSRPAGTD